MKSAFDRTSVIKTLRNGIEKGYWKLEDLDQPSQYTRYNYQERKKALIRSLGTNFNEGIHMPVHKNLLRDESGIDAVHVEVIDPRDLLPPAKNARRT